MGYARVDERLRVNFSPVEVLMVTLGNLLELVKGVSQRRYQSSGF